MGKHLRKLAGLCLFALLLGGCGAEPSTPGGASEDPPVSKETYTVTWKDYDDSVLETDTDVAYGSMPSYDGKTPTRPDDETRRYTFSGWNPKVVAVTGNATYKATYSYKNIDPQYTIDFDLNGGTSASYSGPKTVRAFSDNLLFFDCVKEGWSFRGWMYQGTKIFDEKGNKLADFSMAKEMTFVATYAQTAKLAITMNIEGAGSISGEGEYPYNTYVDVSVVPNQGYNFIGWYYDNTILSSTPDYKYMMWSEDVTLEARFELASFVMNVHSNNEDYGLVLLKSSGNSNYRLQYEESLKYTTQVSVAAYSKTNIRFLGWYDEDNRLVETNAVYSFAMPNHDYSLEAKWSYFTISYVLDGGTNDPSNPMSYTAESDPIALKEPFRSDYEFAGWTLDDEFVSVIDPSWVRDVVLVANWRGSLYTLSVTSGDETKGTVSLLSGSGYAEEKIKVTATPLSGYLFKGWYVGETRVSTETTFTFKMPASDYGLVAHFWTKEERNAAFGVTPTLSADGKSVTYGLYPQTRVTDSSLLSALNGLGDTAIDDNSWYECPMYLYNGDYYAQAKTYHSDYQFENGTRISSGWTYWFKFEPIKWGVLSEINGEYYVVSDVLLDAGQYYPSISTRTIFDKTVSYNNYEHSWIRYWLNNGFYNLAFALGDSAIQTTEVDNSAATHRNENRASYVCANTQDKVFLLSYRDYINKSYGFENDASRQCKTTDFARIHGANGWYWTRSPDDVYSQIAHAVYADGGGLGTLYVDKVCGVRPGLSIKIA